MTKILSSALMALSLFALGNVALASPGPDRDHDRHGHRYDRGHHGNGHYRDSRRGHRWQRGHRYGGPIYVVRDYRHYHLRRPPRGYGWVRADNNEYLLIALATGVILDIALH